jgi:tetratricopeptide (TPR) repeat protein
MGGTHPLLATRNNECKESMWGDRASVDAAHMLTRVRTGRPVVLLSSALNTRLTRRSALHPPTASSNLHNSIRIARRHSARSPRIHMSSDPSEDLTATLQQLEQRHSQQQAILAGKEGDQDALAEEKKIAEEAHVMLRMARLAADDHRSDVRAAEELSVIELGYAELTRSISTTLLEHHDVNGMIGLFQKAHELLLHNEVAGEGGVIQPAKLAPAARHSPVIVEFLHSFGTSFSCLASPDAQMNAVVWKKRVQIYEELIDTVREGNEERKVDELAKVLAEQAISLESAADEQKNSEDAAQADTDAAAWRRAQQHAHGALRMQGTCYFQLKQWSDAHSALRKYAAGMQPLASVLLAKPLMTGSECAKVNQYAMALLEAAEPLKVLKRHSEAIDMYMQALQLLERIQKDENASTSTGASSAESPTSTKVASIVSAADLAGVCNNIAMQHYHCFSHAASISFFERALGHFIAAYGENVPAVEMTRANIATNKQLAVFQAQASVQGAKVTNIDLVNHEPTRTREEEQAEFFTPPPAAAAAPSTSNR